MNLVYCLKIDTMFIKNSFSRTSMSLDNIITEEISVTLINGIDEDAARRIQKSMFPELYRIVESERTGVPRDYKAELKEDLYHAAGGLAFAATLIGGFVGLGKVADLVMPYLS